MTNKSYSVGDLVCLRADPSRQGSIIEILPTLGGKQRYRVFHSPAEIRDYFEDQIQQVDKPTAPEDLTQAVLEGSWVSDQEFRARLTASRLSHPLTDSLYALYAARIMHIPFQFKPLLKVLRADQPRLLIADEVGVGKTIEAGLILKELQTRQKLNNIMVLCPKALVIKWREEMRRFDEDFRIISPETLRYALREAHLDGVWPPQYSRAIANLELLRMEDYMSGKEGKRPGLLTLDPPPKFDLLIVDEAHHLRNPGTNSHELARFLCDISEAVLFLTATPVHVGSENLFSLLNLLRPDLYPDREVFIEMMKPNQYITEAMRKVRYFSSEKTWQSEASKALNKVVTTSWGREVISQEPKYQQWTQKLAQREVLSDQERVRMLRDLEDLHSLAHILNRTRRRDIGKFTIREPHTVSIPFTEEQQSFYDGLIYFRQQVLLEEYESNVVKLITDTLQRQAASCIPGLIPNLDHFLHFGTFSGEVVSDDPALEDTSMPIPEGLQEKVRELRQLSHQLEGQDPKLEQLLQLIESVQQVEGPGKVLLFSFFLHTLHYLYKELTVRGVRTALITGKVKDEDREILRDRFRLPREHQDAIDVLLSSEVGCEGLDYEFCDCLVNYDIPWNPMRIEQRIGRIDRFGQQSDKVMIFNFITPGTVEDRIFFRCFERLGIFEETVGDMEQVLGDLVHDLTQIAADPSLTLDQAEEKAQQIADNAIRLIEEEKRLEEDSEELIGLGQSFTKEVDNLIEEKRYVSPAEIQFMVERFVEIPELDGRIIPADRYENAFQLRMRNKSREKLASMVKDRESYRYKKSKFARWLRGSDPYFLITFDQQAALQNRQIPFITPVHPLARTAASYWMGQTKPLTANLELCDRSLPEGRFLFICDLWEAIGIKQEVSLHCLAWQFGHGVKRKLLGSELLRRIPNASQSIGAPEVGKDDINNAVAELEEEADQDRLRALGELQERNKRLLEKKRNSLEVYHSNRVRRVELELSRAQDERIIRMKQSERDRIMRDFYNSIQELEDMAEPDIITQRIAAGFLEVVHAK